MIISYTAVDKALSCSTSNTLTRTALANKLGVSTKVLQDFLDDHPQYKKSLKVEGDELKQFILDHPQYKVDNICKKLGVTDMEVVMEYAKVHNITTTGLGRVNDIHAEIMTIVSKNIDRILSDYPFKLTRTQLAAKLSISVQKLQDFLDDHPQYKKSLKVYDNELQQFIADHPEYTNQQISAELGITQARVERYAKKHNITIPGLGRVNDTKLIEQTSEETFNNLDTSSSKSNTVSTADTTENEVLTEEQQTYIDLLDTSIVSTTEIAESAGIIMPTRKGNKELYDKIHWAIQGYVISQEEECKVLSPIHIAELKSLTKEEINNLSIAQIADKVGIAMPSYLNKKLYDRYYHAIGKYLRKHKNTTHKKNKYVSKQKLKNAVNSTEELEPTPEQSNNAHKRKLVDNHSDTDCAQDAKKQKILLASNDHTDALDILAETALHGDPTMSNSDDTAEIIGVTTL